MKSIMLNLIFLSLSLPVMANTVKFEFSGYIDIINSNENNALGNVYLNQPFNGWFSYSSVPDKYPDPSCGAYSQDASISVTLGTQVISYIDDYVIIVVWNNNYYGADSFLHGVDATQGDFNFTNFAIRLSDSTGMVYNNDDLPISFNLTQFDSTRLSMAGSRYPGRDWFSIRGKITNMTLVPEPAKTYYVNAADGSDNNDGLSPETPFATIQKAIDSAFDGDTVLVADGTYTGPGNRDIDFLGKAITVRSENGPNNCIIDCQNSGGAFDFESGEDANSIVEGFTLINGKREGIFCHESSPTITNCIITNNWGDGIFCHESSPTITNCTISDNRRGGIFCRGSSLTITNCTISGNSGREGGGICCWESSPTITNCTITGNLAHGPGGGIFCRGSSLTITNCTISGNSTRGDGGAIFFSPHYEDDTLTITGSTITGNSAGSGGGAIACYESSATITDCTISENTGGKSGGIYCEKASLVITDCIISKNTGEWSGGIYCTEGSLDITGCTIAGNSSEGEWALGGGISCVFAASPTITNCAIIGNSSKGNFFLGGGGIIGYSPFISDCIIAGNSAERGGGIICGGGNTTITNCIITGNLANEHGGGILISGDHTTIVNCTFAGNSALNGNAVACDSYEQCYPSDLFIMNSILWDGGNEIWNNDGSTISINYSDVQGGYTGEENIDDDPCFVEPGYWDANDTPDDVNDDFWIEGDYYLLPDSFCIDAGDPNYIPEPGETDIDGNPRVINGRIDMGAYETNYIQAQMKLTPQMLNCNSRANWVKAHFVLPEGFLPEDVDVSEPAVAEPIGAESEYIKVLGADTGPVRLEICFDREAFCDLLTEDDSLEVTVIGSLTTSRYFYATDTIKIKP